MRKCLPENIFAADGEENGEETSTRWTMWEKSKIGATNIAGGRDG